MATGKYGADNSVERNSDSSVKKGDKKFEQSREVDYRLVFKHNRSYELHVWQSVFRFEPMGSLVVPEWVINHPDFKQQADKFIVKEVS